MARSAARRTTTDRLHADIDSGRTGDKVPAPDPAAAPLGTDEEAGATASVASPWRAGRAQGADRHAAVTRQPSYTVIAAIICVALAMIAAILLAG